MPLKALFLVKNEISVGCQNLLTRLLAKILFIHCGNINHSAHILSNYRSTRPNCLSYEYLTQHVHPLCWLMSYNMLKFVVVLSNKNDQKAVYQRIVCFFPLSF